MVRSGTVLVRFGTILYANIPSAGMKKELRAMHEAFLYVMATRKMHVLARVHLTTANQRIELAKRVLSLT